MKIKSSRFSFKGEKFTSAFFDERTIFPHPIDPHGFLKADEVISASYADGLYGFRLMSREITVHANVNEVVPDSLNQAAESILEVLEEHGDTMPVSLVESSCSFVLDELFLGETGIEFCSRFVSDTVRTVVGGELGPYYVDSFTGVEESLFRVRIEPDHPSEGSDLFVSVAHIDTVKQEPLGAEDYSEPLKEYIEVLYERIHREIET